MSKSATGAGRSGSGARAAAVRAGAAAQRAEARAFTRAEAGVHAHRSPREMGGVPAGRSRGLVEGYACAAAFPTTMGRDADEACEMGKRGGGRAGSAGGWRRESSGPAGRGSTRCCPAGPWVRRCSRSRAPNCLCWRVSQVCRRFRADRREGVPPSVLRRSDPCPGPPARAAVCGAKPCVPEPSGPLPLGTDPGCHGGAGSSNHPAEGSRCSPVPAWRRAAYTAADACSDQAACIHAPPVAVPGGRDPPVGGVPRFSPASAEGADPVPLAGRHPAGDAHRRFPVGSGRAVRVQAVAFARAQRGDDSHCVTPDWYNAASGWIRTFPGAAGPRPVLSPDPWLQRRPAAVRASAAVPPRDANDSRPSRSRPRALHEGAGAGAEASWRGMKETETRRPRPAEVPRGRGRWCVSMPVSRAGR
jgi:hypothetical protein